MGDENVEFLEADEEDNTNYRNGPNKFFYNNFTRYVKIGLSQEILEKLENVKERATCRRVSVFGPGTIPYFCYNDSLSPVKTWKLHFQKFLATNILGLYRVPTSKEARCEQLTYNIDKKPQDDIKFSDEQLEFVSKLLEIIADPSMFDVMILNGKAGSGKTTILKYIHSLRTKGIHSTYITMSKFLCEDVRRRIYEGDDHVFTVCSFVMKHLKFSYGSTIMFQELLKHVPHNTLDKEELVIDVNFMHNPLKNSWQRVISRLKHKNSAFLKISKRFAPATKIFFIDEYSLLTAGVIGMILNILKRTGFKVIVIFAGDMNQIQALFQRIHSCNSFLKSIARHETTLVNNFRASDKEYADFLDGILTTNTVPDYMRSYIPRCMPYIDYNYPLHMVLDMPDNEDLNILREWIEDNQFYNTCSHIIFAFQNEEVHYNNLSLAVSVYNQICKKADMATACRLVKFQLIFKVKWENKVMKLKGKYPAQDTLDGKVPILPLVVGLDYKVLSRVVPLLPRSSILTLIKIEKDSLLMYSQQKKEFYKIYDGKYQMNLYRGVELYGFPLQMYSSETSCSAQGVTIERDVYANFSANSRSEAYVIMSRVRTKNRIKSVFIP